MSNMIDLLTDGVQQMTENLVRMNQETQSMLIQATELMAASKAIIRDNRGRVIGLKPMVN